MSDSIGTVVVSGVILECNVTAPDDDVNIKYKVASLEESLIFVSQTFTLPTRNYTPGAKLNPSKPGDPCTIVADKNGVRFYVQEAEAANTCP